MAILQVIEVREDKETLQKYLRRASVSSKCRLKMLLWIKKGMHSTQQLAAKLGVCRNCIAVWKKLYQREGVGALLQEKRGGHKQGGISKDHHVLIEAKLREVKGGFTSYKQAQAWINERFGLQMKYDAVNKYLKHHFHTKLKTGRKSHVQKDPLAEAAFKKGVRH